MGEASGFFVFLAGVFSAWIAAHYGFLNTRIAEKRTERAESEKYKREWLRDQERSFIEPLRQEIDGLQSFIAAVANYYFIASSDAYDDQAKLTAKAELMKVSDVAYRYESILGPLTEFHSEDGGSSHYFNYIRSQTATVLDNKRDELNERLATSQLQPNETKQDTKIAASGGPLVRLALWVEQRYKS